MKKLFAVFHICTLQTIKRDRERASQCHSYFIIIWTQTHLVPLRKVIYKINTARYYQLSFTLVPTYLLFGATFFLLSHKLFNLHFLSLTTYYNCIDQPHGLSALLVWVKCFFSFWFSPLMWLHNLWMFSRCHFVYEIGCCRKWIRDALPSARNIVIKYAFPVSCGCNCLKLWFIFFTLVN